MSGGYVITELSDDSGHWTATVTLEGRRVHRVSRESGSWIANVGTEDEPRLVHVRPDIAETLQAQLSPIEKQRRQAEAAEEAA